jgi:hypothetical protein
MFHRFGTVAQKREGGTLSVLEGVTVLVYSYPGNILQSVFADESSTPKPVILSDENGNFDFYIPVGDYTEEYIYQGAVIERNENIGMNNDNDEPIRADLANPAAGSRLVAPFAPRIAGGQQTTGFHFFKSTPVLLDEAI